MTTELREAASLMRARAKAAILGPWNHDGEGLISHVNGYDERVYVAEGYDDAPGLRTLDYVASWHPVVALAVADWLDNEAAKQTPTTHLAVTFDGTPMFPVDPAALAVARAYLGPR